MFSKIRILLKSFDRHFSFISIALTLTKISPDLGLVAEAFFPLAAAILNERSEIGLNLGRNSETNGFFSNKDSFAEV